MSSYVTVRVTQEDIDAGKPGTSTHCPVALAADRALGTSETRVYDNEWWPQGYESDASGRYVKAPLPKSAQRFINRFDYDLPVQPATFRLPLP